MHWYPQTPVLRFRQLMVDSVVLAWVLGWLLIARLVHATVSALAAPVDPMRRAGEAFTQRMTDVAGRIGAIPIVGDDLQGPFTGSAAAGADLSLAAERLQASVDRAAWWLSLLTCGTPIALVLTFYVIFRLRGVRRLHALARYRDDPGARPLLALRALVTARSKDVAQVSSDPLGDWQRGDSQVIEALASLELRRNGLRSARR